MDHDKNTPKSELESDSSAAISPTPTNDEAVLLKNKTIEPDGSTSWDLPSGKRANMKQFKGKDVINSQRFIGDTGGDVGSFQNVMIAQITTVDGKNFVPEALAEMDGWDYLSIIGAFGTTNPSAASLT